MKLSGKALREDGKVQQDLVSIEAVISRQSVLAGLSVRDLALSYTRGVNLLAVSRRGERLRERLRDLVLQEGDVIVLQGGRKTLPIVLQDLALLPLAQQEVMLGTSARP